MNNYVTVYIANGQLDAEMVQGFLEAAGIPAMISQESIGRVFGMTTGPLGEVNVLVPEKKTDEALELLASMERGDLIDNNGYNDSSEDENNEGGN
ncbi:MAG: DUF2007 domain-containing protein [Anaerolineaceae bacterium]